MKTLHLIRHAKSSWAEPGLSDFERPLNKRGQKSCTLMASHIVNAGCKFENVYCSSALRARLTIDGIHHALLDTDFEWQVDDALYTFSNYDLLNWCQKLDDALNEVVIVGHNPALTQFCNEMGDRYIENLPTCGYAQLTFPQNSWSDLTSASGKLVTFLTPKSVN